LGWEGGGVGVGWGGVRWVHMVVRLRLRLVVLKRHTPTYQWIADELEVVTTNHAGRLLPDRAGGPKVQFEAVLEGAIALRRRTAGAVVGGQGVGGRGGGG
jgi:hypothetical protein